MSTADRITPSDLVLYRSPKGVVKVGVLVRDETVWLTQRALSELFAVGVPAIAKHLKNIFESGELDASATVSKMEMVQHEGAREVTRAVDFYNLDPVIAVGYRVNSYEATQFRIWATRVLRDLSTQGFVLDDERLKQGTTVFGKDYFDGLLERIREIRASERRFYRPVYVAGGRSRDERVCGALAGPRRCLVPAAGRSYRVTGPAVRATGGSA